MDTGNDNADPEPPAKDITYQLVPFVSDEVCCNFNIKQEPPDDIEDVLEESEEITIKQECFSSEEYQTLDEYEIPNEKEDYTEEDGFQDSRASTLTSPTTMPCMAIIEHDLKEKRSMSSEITSKGDKDSLVDSDGKTLDSDHFLSDTLAENADFDETELNKQECSYFDTKEEIGVNEEISRDNLQKSRNIESSNQNIKNLVLDNDSQVIPERYKCHICGNSYGYPTGLTRHMKTHSQHKCELCGKTFVALAALDKHRLLHRTGKQQKTPSTAAKNTVKSFNPQMKSLGKSSALVQLRKQKINKTQKLGATTKMATSSHMNVPKLKSLKTVGGRQIFPCHFCGKNFSWHYLLKRHKQTHLTKRSAMSNQKLAVRRDWSCITCKKTFGSKYHLIRHEDTEGHKEQLKLARPSKYPCNICNKIFCSLRNLIRHRDTIVHKLQMKGKVREAPDQKHSCGECRKVFASLQELKKHKLTHLSSLNKEKKLKGILYTCQICKKSFSWLSEVRKHLISAAHVSNVNNVKKVKVEDGKSCYSCNVCGKVFSQPRSLRLHQHSSGHGTEGHHFVCGTCGRKFPKETDLNKHQFNTNHVSKFKTEPQGYSQVLHSCDKCDKTFPWSYQLNNHKISHMPKKYPCNMCDKYFAAEYLLKKHKIVHTKRLTILKSEKLPHVKVTVCTCNACGEKFAQLSRLRKHKAMCHRSPKMLHPNTNIYLSEAKKFPSVKLLGKNLLSTATEVGNKPNVKLVHACVICNRTFARMRDLHSHRAKTGHNAVEPKQEDANVSNESGFSCDVCGKMLSRFSDLCRHKAMTGHNTQKHQNLNSKSENSSSVIKTESALPVSQEQRKLTPTLTVKKNCFSCDVCGKILSRLSDLSRHKAMAGHNSQVDQNPYTKTENIYGITSPLPVSAEQQQKLTPASTAKQNYFSCDVCGKKLSRLSDLSRHKAMTGHNSLVFQNLYRKSENTSDVNETKSPLPVLAEQWKASTKENSFSCDVCGKTLSRLSDLSRHKSMAGHNTPMFQNSNIKSENNCDIETKPPLPVSAERCKLTPTSTDKGTEHSKAYACNTCNRRFSRLSDLSRHRGKSGHSLQPEIKAEKTLNKDPQKQYSCGTCNKKFSRQNDLRRHVAVTGHAYESLSSDKGTSNKNEYLFSNTLGRAFSHTDLNTHEQPAKNVSAAFNLQESVNFYPCHVCGKAFPWQYQLNNHKCHGQTKKYSCKTCDKHFAQEYLLKRHKLLHASHSAQSTKKCNTCYRVFSRQSDLSRHLNVSGHVGTKSEPKFYCQFCNKFFWRLCDLKRHENKFGHHSYALNMQEKALNHFTEVAKKKVPQQNNAIKHSTVVGQASNLTVAKRKEKFKTMHQCNVCKRKYSWYSGLHRHRIKTGHV